ncbi:GAF domain-containing protein [bacterium]|nr:MAG: GAF domain-containing protein [bacterium]
MIERPVADLLLQNLGRIEDRGRALREKTMRLLNDLPGYEWSGVYRLEGDTLHLDAYTGDATDHTVIPVGRGVCGTAVAERRSQVIEDVQALDNYLSCSIKTRSEIVVLIERGDEILGQIDIDGHEVGAFDASDEGFLRRVAAILADRWE